MNENEINEEPVKSNSQEIKIRKGKIIERLYAENGYFYIIQEWKYDDEEETENED